MTKYGLNWPKHPLLRCPTDEAVQRLVDEHGAIEAGNRLGEIWAQLWEAYENEKRDPLKYGVVLPSWRRMEELFREVDNLWVFGGNRSSKSRSAAWLVMQALLENPGAKIYCWSQNSKSSKWNQQPYLYELLPPELRKRQQDAVVKINYSKANGFTDDTFILPNGSHCVFATYSQYLNDPSFIEGIELGAHEGSYINIGNWFDEYLGGPELLETMRMRLVTRNAKNLITFTPIDGFTEVVREVLDGAKTLEDAPVDGDLGLRVERVPVVQEPRSGNERVLFLHTRDNPFNDYERSKREWAGKNQDYILCRAYGVPTRSATSVFPRFSRPVHVVSPDAAPTKDVTLYQIIDPAGSKNWAMIWVAVDPTGTWWVYREWPEIDDGEWAEWREGKWRPGIGARGQGYGISDYVAMIRDLEAGEVVAERIIDPRLGAAKYAGPAGESSIIQDLEDQGVIAIPAPGLDIDDGLQALQGLMSYDTEREIDAQNRPRFYISERCENTIRSMQEYTGEDGPKEAWKDFVDCLRYGAVSGIDHQGTDFLSSRLTTKPGGY
jgi:hypothetical protein